MGAAGMQRTYLLWVGLGLVGASGLALLPLAGSAGVFGSQPLAEGATVALAQPLDGDRWNLILVEQLRPGAASCWSRQGDGSVTIAAENGAAENSAAENGARGNGIARENGGSLASSSQIIRPRAADGDSRCSRLQSSSGYSLRAADGELPSPWRLRIAAGAAGLELQALNPSLTTPVPVARAPMPPAAGEGLASFRLEPGWSFQGRTYAGRRLSHIYLASAEPLALLQARARGSVQPFAGLPPLPPPLELAQRDRRRPESWRRPGRISSASIEPAPSQPAPGQVISLPVLPFQEALGLSATTP
jgi:hypothetical protein